MPNLRYAHWYAHDTHRRIYMYYAALSETMLADLRELERPEAGENTEHRRSPIVPCQNRAKTPRTVVVEDSFERKADSPNS